MNKNIFKDMSKIAGSAFSTASNIKNDVVDIVKHQVEVFVKKMNFITREEFNVVKKLIAKTSEELQDIKESAMASKEISKKKVSCSKMASKKTLGKCTTKDMKKLSTKKAVSKKVVSKKS